MKQIFYNPKTAEFTFAEYNADKSQNVSVIPPRFSPQDKYGAYRRKSKLL